MTAYGLGARPQTFAPLLGDGILTQDSAPWKHSREMLRPLFSLNRGKFLTQVEEHTEHLVSCIPTNKFYRPATSILPIHIPHNYVSPFRQVDELFTG